MKQDLERRKARREQDGSWIREEDPPHDPPRWASLPESGVPQPAPLGISIADRDIEDLHMPASMVQHTGTLHLLKVFLQAAQELGKNCIYYLLSVVPFGRNTRWDAGMEGRGWSEGNVQNAACLFAGRAPRTCTVDRIASIGSYLVVCSHSCISIRHFLGETNTRRHSTALGENSNADQLLAGPGGKKERA